MCNTTLLVKYTNDDEYQIMFNGFFHIDEYNDEVIKRELDSIYESTKDNPLFQNIYQKLAAKFLSLDCEIGLAVAFSYSYFRDFYPLLVGFLSGEKINEENQYYQNLLA